MYISIRFFLQNALVCLSRVPFASWETETELRIDVPAATTPHETLAMG